MLTGRHKPLSMMQGIDSGVDGVVFLGYHAGAGVEGVLSHTYLPNPITGVWLDGVPRQRGRAQRRARRRARRAGPARHRRRPDLRGRRPTYAPDARTVAVKECVSRYAAICLPPAGDREPLIARGAEAAMARAGRFAGAVAGHRIEVEFDAAHLADGRRRRADGASRSTCAGSASTPRR